MKFSYAWLQEYIDKKLSAPKNLGELLTMHSFEVENIERVEEDSILDMDVLPNRAGDCLSHIGVAREIAALIGGNLKDSVPQKSKAVKIFSHPCVEVRNEAQGACLRYTVACMSGVTVGPSPDWLSRRLRAVGLRSVNNVVDAANYVMLETGQPLHVFDYDKLGGGTDTKKTIVVRRAEKGERITTLEGEEYELEPSVLVIADTKEALALAGIKGGKKAEVDAGTKKIVIESANFNRASIRAATRLLGLFTDASYRFEHGVPITFAPWASERLVRLIQKVAGGKTEGKTVDLMDSKQTGPRIVALSRERLCGMLGIDIPLKQAADILRSLEFEIARHNAQTLSVRVPAFREDIENEEDVIEEVGRMYGYEKIVPIMPAAVLALPSENEEHEWEQFVKQTLKGLGATELYNHSFISGAQKEAWGYARLQEVENPLSAEFQYLRPALLPNMLKIGAANLRYSSSVLLFEIGEIFLLPAPTETRHLSIMIADKMRKEDMFYRLKGLVDAFLESAGIFDIWYDAALAETEKREAAAFHPARLAQIKVGNPGEKNALVGWIGEIHPRVIDELKLKGGFVAAELDFTKLAELAKEERLYSPPPRYPAIVRDISLLVPLRTQSEFVIQKIEDIGGPLIADVDLFDMYDGEELEDDTKSIAFHIVFQSDERTLTSKEADEIMAKITSQCEQEGWETRK